MIIQRRKKGLSPTDNKEEEEARSNSSDQHKKDHQIWTVIGQWDADVLLALYIEANALRVATKLMEQPCLVE
jgi:hypothetical protein